MSNKELQLLIKNELEYSQFTIKSSHIYKNIYNKYKNIIDESTNFLAFNCSYQEKLYCYINNIKNQPKCSHCKKNIVKFREFRYGYTLYCSKNCFNKRNILSIEQQKELCYKIYKNDYLYYWETYIDNSTPMKMKCKTCNHIFYRDLNNHKNSKMKCPKCCYKNRKLPNKRLTIKQVEQQFKSIHNDKYEYDWTTYDYQTTKMRMICPLHGEFWQRPLAHKVGTGCPICKHKNNIIPEDIIKQQFFEIHKGVYSYNWSSYVNGYTKMEIICSIHGKFKQTPTDHKNGQGCPICKSSKGELKIASFLNKKNIKFKKEKRFNDCKDKNKLPFDFYLIDHNICIEYDGIQHFEPISQFGGEDGFKMLKFHDNIKNNYCFVNKIKLIRIPYWDFDNIEEILTEEIF